MMTVASGRLIVTIGIIIAGLAIRVDSEKQWWQTTTLYQIYPQSFKDSDGNGLGDLNGITSKLEHLNDMGIETVWLSPFFKSPEVDNGYDVSDYIDVNPKYGTLEDFDNLVARAKELGIKVVLDYVPNHTSTEHEWFKLSEARVAPYTDYYVWHEGILDANGTRRPPNNWLSVFNSGSAWQWSDKRQAYYLHQFEVRQADLNFTNPDVLQETRNILTFWLDRGIAGYRIDSAPYLFEDADFRDEPLSGLDGYTSNDYYYLKHLYTKDLIENYNVIQMWRDHIDNYNSKVNDGLQRAMFTEAYANISMVVLYYDYGSQIPFNFFFIKDKDGVNLDTKVTASDVKNTVDMWMNNMPVNGTANWVIGNHDNSRAATRYGTNRVDSLNFILLLLPGVMTVYNGDEIGMTDTYISWEETQDPQACSTDPDRYQAFSRDPERTPFQWDDSTSAGFSTNSTTFLPVNTNYRTLNLAAQKAADKSYYKNFQAVMRLRNTTVAKNGNLTSFVIKNQIFAFSRELEGHDPLIVVVNWGNTSVQANFDKLLFNDNQRLKVILSNVGSNIEVGSTILRSSITLAPHAALVLTTSSSGFLCSGSMILLQVSCLISVFRSFFNS
ncbi:alpha-glucosidase [Cephus cinctus]|uniref:alpha-glucosidase n=1 Tax=Cephus cinctus TaxID=211228 RepID=A0AAJ7CCC9_CEPCN|nr:alpha-glucosidase [Cephus cinctus]